jgi:formylglycine-generating enzyme required for sulfatase activity
MKYTTYEILLTLLFLIVIRSGSIAQKLIPFKLPDTGQNTGYTSSNGEDSDFIINPMSFTDNGDGTITDNNTGLMWQKTDGGEMVFENAVSYCSNLKLGGYNDWRLPLGYELFSINKYDFLNPAINTAYFTKTLVEYWYTSELRIDDTSKVWVVNSGGGIGAHPKSETISNKGTRRFHVRAVRNLFSTTFNLDHFSDNGDGTIKDNYTGLVWQKIQSPNTMTWEEALSYSSGLSLAGKSDWRLPNIKELQSLNDEKFYKPSFNKNYFINITSGNFWSSTTLIQTTSKAWDLNTEYGIVSYDDKSLKQNVICVRGGSDKSDLNFKEVALTGGEYEMGDHFGFVDPSHPSDELPIHKVKVNSFNISAYETTNQQFLEFLNYYLIKGLIEVKNNIVYSTGGGNIYYYTTQSASYYSIGYDGKVFSISDFRSNHPVVGVMWFGAAAFCNWLSSMNGLNECYDLKTGKCDFTKNGYRLPTEAEWEYAGRGGHTNPYYNYPWGNDQDITKANWPDSKDPYEGKNESEYPFTTPVGFYDGKIHSKSEYNWPGSALSYQTSNGTNSFGLYDMAGNVWELINDWYGQNYYSISPYDNPKGPDSGFVMPDGKAYRGMRGGNWYNGYTTTNINDGHSRVSNRNPSYYRGPLDPNHPWYHVGFRVARNSSTSTGILEKNNEQPEGFKLYQNYPNPFNPVTTIIYKLPITGFTTIKIYNILGKEISTLVNEKKNQGMYEIKFDSSSLPGGVYFCKLNSGIYQSSIKMCVLK